MRILIDFTQIPVDRTGVGVYAENLVRDLIPILNSEDFLFLLVQDDEPAVPLLSEKAPNARVLSIPSRIFRNRLLLLLYEQCILPLLLFLNRIDIVHSLHYTHPLIPTCARVVTVHDLTFLLWPQLHTRSRRLVMPFFIRHALKGVEAVIFVSNSARHDAERLAPGRNHIWKVVPHGVDPRSFVKSMKQEQDGALSRLGISRPYILFLGTIEPRKNLALLVQAFEKVAINHPECILVLAGKLGWHYEPLLRAFESSPVQNRIRYLGYVSATEKQALLAGCEMLVYPTLYEGFGLPVLEAMAAGAPVITSNVSALPEVAGNAAILIDPGSTEQLASAIESLLTQAGLAEQLRSCGYEQVKKFTWSRTSRETYDTYRMAAFRKPAEMRQVREPMERNQA